MLFSHLLLFFLLVGSSHDMVVPYGRPAAAAAATTTPTPTHSIIACLALSFISLSPQLPRLSLSTLLDSGFMLFIAIVYASKWKIPLGEILPSME